MAGSGERAEQNAVSNSIRQDRPIAKCGERESEGEDFLLTSPWTRNSTNLLLLVRQQPDRSVGASLPQNRHMPAVKGCQSCRRRHDKCVVRADQSVCDGCIHGDRQCIFDNKYRFKAVYHVDTISQGCKTRTNLVYDTDQPWVPTRRPLDIVLENGVDTLSLDTTDFLGHDRLDDQGPLPAATLSKDPKESPFAAHVSAELPPNPGAVSQPGPEDSLSFAKRRPDDSDASLPQGSVTTADVYSPSRAPWLDQIGRQSSHFVELAWSQTSASPLTPSSSVLDQLRPDYYAGEIGALRRQDSNRYTKSPHSTVDSISRKQRTERVFLSYREAFLVQHFIQKIAPWVGHPTCLNANRANVRRSIVATPTWRSQEKFLDEL